MTKPRLSKTIVVVSGAAGNISYSFLPLLASGYIFGRDWQIDEIRLLDIPSASKAMEGVRMELIDCAFPCVTEITSTTDPFEAFQDATVAILIGGFPRQKGMLRKDLIQQNTKIFVQMGRAIHEVASPNVKVLVVANPANTNCLVAIHQCFNHHNRNRIKPENFCALTYLDYSRARAQIAAKLKKKVDEINNVIIWGNHSATQYPDAMTNAYVVDSSSLPMKSIHNTKQNVSDLFASRDNEKEDWLQTDFIDVVQQRGKAILETRQKSSAMSAGVAAADCLRKWLVTGTSPGETVPMAVYNDKGYYGVEPGLVFSFPCQCIQGKIIVQEGLDLSDFAKNRIKQNEQELIEERAAAMEILKHNNGIVEGLSSRL